MNSLNISVVLFICYSVPTIQRQLEQRNQSPQLDKTGSPGNHNRAHSDGCEALNAASISEDKRPTLLDCDHTDLDPITLQESYLLH